MIIKKETDADDQYSNVTTIRKYFCEVCGCNTHEHNDCKIRWKDKSTSKRPEIDRYEMAKLSNERFDKMWEQVCKTGCLKNRSMVSRSKLKSNILDQRKRNYTPN